MEMGASAPPEPAFVGREAELEVVANAIDAVRSATPRIVWIEGEPGIGKTAFMHRFLSGLEEVTVLDVSGEESETALGYGVVLQVLAQAVPGVTWDRTWSFHVAATVRTAGPSVSTGCS